MNICIAGKNSIAVSVLSYVVKNYEEYNNILVIPNFTDTGQDTWQPSLTKYVRSTNGKAYISNLDEVYKLDNLVFISLEYDRIIDPKKFKTNKLYNVHFSLLPKYKGMYTSAHPILNGELESGCTIHQVDRGIDTGNIIAQRRFDIEEEDTAKDLYLKYLACGTELMTEFISKLISGSYDSHPQAQMLSTYYSKESINYKNLKIDLNQTAYGIRRQLQAFSFRDYQLPLVAGYSVSGSKISSDRSTSKAGTIIAEDDFSITISSIDYNIILQKDKFEELLAAVSEDDVHSIKCILNNNPKLVGESNHAGWTPLIIAAFNGKNASLHALLEFGASPNQPNSKGTTPLMYAKDCAERTGDLYGVRQLLEYGADTSKKDIFGKSILDYINPRSPAADEIYALLKN